MTAKLCRNVEEKVTVEK